MENGSSRVKFSRGRSAISHHLNLNARFSQGRSVIIETKLTHGFRRFTLITNMITTNEDQKHIIAYDRTCNMYNLQQGYHPFNFHAMQYTKIQIFYLSL
jgi:hypothetical protein